MNEYLVEDEYSFYEIDPECKIEAAKDPGKRQKLNHKKSCEWKENRFCYKTTKSSGRRCPCCFCWILYLIFCNKFYRDNCSKSSKKVG